MTDPRVSDNVEFNRRKMNVFGRLRENVSLEQARAEMVAIGKQLAEQDATQNAGFGVNVFPVYVEDVGQGFTAQPSRTAGGGWFRPAHRLREHRKPHAHSSDARQKEMGNPQGAWCRTWRLISQLLAESLLLSGSGAVLGLAAPIMESKGWSPCSLRESIAPSKFNSAFVVVLFTVLISISGRVLFGIVPACRRPAPKSDFAQSDPRVVSRCSAECESSSSCRKWRWPVCCLVGAGFMIKSLVAVFRVDPGFKPDHLLTMKFSLPQSRYASGEQTAAFCRQVLEKVASAPGVERASFSDGLPLTRIRLTKFMVEGQPEPARGSEPTADLRGIFTLNTSTRSGSESSRDEISPLTNWRTNNLSCDREPDARGQALA